MILITGAAGKSGRALLRELAARHQEPRVFVRSAAQAEWLMKNGAAEAVVGDLLHVDGLHVACRGADAVYHICPNMHPAEVAIARNVIQASLDAGVSHFVYHSVLHPQTEEMPHHWQKLRVEELLLKSGLTFTILQPAAYMQNVAANREIIRRRGLYRVPYRCSTRLGLVDLCDVAEAAARVLTEPDHDGAIYELAGGEILDQHQIAAILTDVLGQPISAVEISRDDWARTSGLDRGSYALDSLLKMFVYYEKYGFWGNSNVLALVLGRSPTTFCEYAAREEW